MATVKAIGKYLATSHTKARPVINLIRGKGVEEALNILKFTNKKPARLLEKLLKSAVANAEENEQIEKIEALYIQEIFITNGPTAKRFMPRARGRACRIRKRSSHLKITLTEK